MTKKQQKKQFSDGLKPVAKQRNKVLFNKIKNLPNYPEIEKRIFSGESIEKIAKWLHKERPHEWKCALSTKVRKLYELKAELKKVCPEKIPTLRPKYLEDAIQELKDRGYYLNLAEEEVKVIRQMKKRLKRALAKEKQNDCVSDTTTRIFKELISALAQHRETQQIIGILKPTPTTVIQTAMIIQQQIASNRSRIQQIRKMPPEERFNLYESQFTKILEITDVKDEG